MVFFNTGVDGNGNEFFEVSSCLWYYPATAIPCTLLVLAIYQIWRRSREGRMVKRRNNSLSDPEEIYEQKLGSGVTIASSSDGLRVRMSGARD